MKLYRLVAPASLVSVLAVPARAMADVPPGPGIDIPDAGSPLVLGALVGVAAAVAFSGVGLMRLAAKRKTTKPECASSGVVDADDPR